MKFFRPHINGFLRRVIISPIILAIPVTFLIVMALPPMQSKNQAELVRIQAGDKFSEPEKLIDMDGDGNSERLVMFSNVNGNAALKLWTHQDRVIDQFNFHGQFINGLKSVAVLDLNQDGIKELLLFTYKQDSIFANILDYAFQPPLIKRFVIEVLDEAQAYQSIPAIAYCDTIRLPNSSSQSLLIGINAGFEIHPRKIILLDTESGKYKQSASLGPVICSIHYMKPKDAEPYFLVFTLSRGNIKPPYTTQLHDQSSWILKFDSQLHFQESLYECNTHPSAIFPLLPLCSDTVLRAFVHNRSSSDLPNVLLEINGDTIVSSPFHEVFQSTNEIAQLLSFEKGEVFLLSKKGGVVKIDDELHQQIVNTNKKMNFYTFSKAAYDLNDDSRLEYIAQDSFTNDIIIFDHAFKNPVRLQPPEGKWMMQKSFSPGIYREVGKAPLLFFKIGDFNYYYRYSNNPLYPFRYLLYLFIYVGVLVFIIGIRRLVESQIRKSYEIQRQIDSLQLTTITSQLEPHFILNALNTVSSVMMQNKLELAQKNLLKFSRLMQMLLKQSDALTVSLASELEFIKKYLEIEQFRFPDKFVFAIDIDPNTDKEVRIPKMLIQLFVENALKHGIHPTKRKGKVQVSVKRELAAIHITVEDNGSGFDPKKKSDSGKGLTIARQMIALYHKQSGIAISFNIQSKAALHSKETGTIVNIEIPE